MTMRRSEAEIRASVEAAYAATVDRLQGEAEFEALKTRAMREAADTPGVWLARNLLWIRIEQHTSLMGV